LSDFWLQPKATVSIMAAAANRVLIIIRYNLNSVKILRDLNLFGLTMQIVQVRQM